MHKLLHLLLILGFVVLINCKGGGGRGGGGRGGGHSYHGTGGGRGGGPISNFVLYAILAPIGVICCCCCLFMCLKSEKGEPSQSNEMFVASVASDSKDVERGGEEVYLNNPFKSGTWSCRYYQYDAWHGPHVLSLSFNNADMTIKGSGTDDIGTFTVEGLYSECTRRIGLTEHYQPGTGDPSQNLGHDVTIQVTYNTRSNQFEGKWYVQTHKYSGDRIEVFGTSCINKSLQTFNVSKLYIF